MASIDDFDPRLLAEFSRYLDPASSHENSLGIPADYSRNGYIQDGAPRSRLEQDAPVDLSPPRGKVVWTAEEYLSSLDLTALRRNIQHYKRISGALLDRPSIRRELSKALGAPGLASIIIPFTHIAVPAGTPLFRARKITRLDEIKQWKDIWTAPPHYIGAGRLNDVGEPILYTAADPLTAAYEIHAKPGELVAMSFFRSTRRIMAIQMTSETKVPDLRKGDRRKLEIIMKFLVGTFSQKVPIADPSRYITPDLIAKEYFSPYPDIYSGWIYKSIADPRNTPGSYNLALRGSTARDHVEYKFTQIVRVDPIDGVSGTSTVVSLLKKRPESDRLIRVNSITA